MAELAKCLVGYKKQSKHALFFLDGDGNGLRYGGGSSNSPLRPSLLQNVDGKDNPGSATNRFMSPMAKFNSNQSQTPFSSFGAPGSSGGMTPFFARQPPATPKPETVPPKTSSQTTSQQPSSEISELEKVNPVHKYYNFQVDFFVQSSICLHLFQGLF